MTGHASIELAVQSVKLGAEHFLTKPVDLPTLVVMLERSLDNQRNRRKQALDLTRRSREGVESLPGTERCDCEAGRIGDSRRFRRSGPF